MKVPSSRTQTTSYRANRSVGLKRIFSTRQHCEDRRMNKNRGFTLVELMVALTVMLVLMVAAPSFVTLIKNNRQTINVNTLLLAMTAARDEAIKRNGAVSVCQTDDGQECSDGG